MSDNRYDELEKYAFTNDRSEKEFICLLSRDHKLKQVWRDGQRHPKNF